MTRAFPLQVLPDGSAILHHSYKAWIWCKKTQAHFPWLVENQTLQKTSFFFLIDNTKLPCLKKELFFGIWFFWWIVWKLTLEHLRCHCRTSAARPSGSLSCTTLNVLIQSRTGRHSPQVWNSCPVNQERKNLPGKRLAP